MEKTAVNRRRRWARDELILALELYSRRKPRELTKQHPEVVELQRLTGRTGNAVYMKLSNFLSIDPEYEGDGLAHVGIADRDLWHEFAERKADLVAAAVTARRRLQHELKSP